MSLTQENNYSSKFSFSTFYLGVGANANFKVISFVCFAFDSVFNGFDNGYFNRVAIKFSPFHRLMGLSNLQKIGQ